MLLREWLFKPFLAGSPGDEDGQAAAAFLAEMEALIESRGATKSAPLALRLMEVWSATTLARGVEMELHSRGLVVQEDAKSGKRDAPNPLIETLNKLVERRRKALIEFEECCGGTGSPRALSLADIMRPIIRESEGILEECLDPNPDVLTEESSTG